MQAEEETGDELTIDEFRDIAPAALVPNHIDVAFLSDALEEAGIPATSDESYIARNCGSLTPLAIRVPRKLLSSARTTIADAVARSIIDRVNYAFNPENVEDLSKTTNKDPVMVEMFTFRNMSSLRRDEILFERVMNWLAEGERCIRIADCLAAAGLSRSEADQLMVRVQEYDEHINNKKSAIYDGGLLLTVFGCVLLIPGYWMALRLRNQGAFILPWILVISGLVPMYHGSKQREQWPIRAQD